MKVLHDKKDPGTLFGGCMETRVPIGNVGGIEESPKKSEYNCFKICQLIWATYFHLEIKWVEVQLKKKNPHPNLGCKLLALKATIDIPITISYITI